METATTATQSNNSTTANQKLQRAAIQLLQGYTSDTVTRHLKRKREDGSPTYTTDALKKIMRESFYKSLAMYHSEAPGFDKVYDEVALKLDALVDKVAASMK